MDSTLDKEGVTVQNGLMATFVGPPPTQPTNGRVKQAGVLVRELPPEEYEQLASIPPFDKVGVPSPMNSRILLAQKEDSGEVVGFFALSACVHVEPLYIVEEYRHKPGIAKRMWKAMRDLLLNTGNFFAFAVINDADIPRGVLSQAVRLGFNRVPGGLYMLNVLDPALDKVAGELPNREQE